MTNTVSSLDAALAAAITKASESSGQVWDATASGIGKAIDVIQAETPLVIQEFLTWKAIEVGVPLVLTLAAALVCVCALIFFRRWSKHKDFDWDDLSGVIVILGSMISGVGLLFLICASTDNIIELAKIKYAPRVYLIDYVATTLKK